MDKSLRQVGYSFSFWCVFVVVQAAEVGVGEETAGGGFAEGVCRWRRSRISRI